ncbi:MAG: pentapeptide repeat-containing protein [Neisseriaceae bacterium]
MQTIVNLVGSANNVIKQGKETIISNYFAPDEAKLATEKKLENLLRHEEPQFRLLGRDIIQALLQCTYNYGIKDSDSEAKKTELLKKIGGELEVFKIENLNIKELEEFITPRSYSYYTSPYVTNTFAKLLKDNLLTFKLCCRNIELQKFYVKHLSTEDFKITIEMLNDFSGQDLQNEDLHDSDFTCCNFTGADLSGAILNGTNFTKAIFLRLN